MRAVRLQTTDGLKWVNPDAVSVLWARDESVTRVHTPAGFLDVPGTPEDVSALLWGPAAKSEVKRGR